MRTDVQLVTYIGQINFEKRERISRQLEYAINNVLYQKDGHFYRVSKLPSRDVGNKMNVSSLARQIYRLTIFIEGVKGFLM